MLGLLSVVLAGPVFAERITVAVASNFTPTLRELVADFETRTGHQVTLANGSTGKHYAQIMQGAPFDAFFAADAERPRRLVEAGRAEAASRFTYAVGRLVLWSPAPERFTEGRAILQTGDFRRLAIANPRLAPYGAAARQTLTALGRYDALTPTIVRGENIGQAFQFVRSGAADLGFVALSQLTRVEGEPGSRWLVPAHFHDPIEQQAVLIRDTGAGRALLRYVRSDAARAILTRAGYGLPEAP